MKNLKAQLKRYRLFIIMLLINLVLFIVDPVTGSRSAKISVKNLFEMLSIIPPIFLLLGLLDVWIPKETMMRYMGKEAGAKGWIFAFALGSFSAGPLYASFPVAAVFLKKGVSLTNVFLFVGAWSTTKIPMMLFEVTQLGAKFAVSRFILNLIGIAAIAVIMEKTTSKEQAQKIYELAAAEADEGKLKKGGPKGER